MSKYTLFFPFFVFFIVRYCTIIDGSIDSLTNHKNNDYNNNHSYYPSQPRKLPVTSEFSFNKFGRQWYIKDSRGEPWAPGPCIWVPSLNHVYADDQGIHLTVAPVNPPLCNPFVSTEVWDTTARGYGNYLFHITGPFLHMDPQVTFGLFTFDEDAPQEIYREIDFEIGKWGNKGDNTQIQFVIQPYNVQGNLHRADISRTARYGGEYGPEGGGACTDPGPNGFNGGQFEKLSLLMQWFGGPPTKLVRFYVFDGHIPLSTILQAKNALLTAWDFPYPDRIPNAGNERIHFNLWQCNWGGSPDYGRRVHVIINNYEFSPAWMDFPAAGMYVPRHLQQQQPSAVTEGSGDTPQTNRADRGSTTTTDSIVNGPRSLSPSHAHSPVESMDVPQSVSIMHTEGKRSEEAYAAVAYSGHSGHNEDVNNNVILDKGRGLSYEAGQPSGHPGGFIRYPVQKGTGPSSSASGTPFPTPLQPPVRSMTPTPTGTLNENIFLGKSTKNNLPSSSSPPVLPRYLQQQAYPHSGSGAVPGAKVDVPPTSPPVTPPSINPSPTASDSSTVNPSPPSSSSSSSSPSSIPSVSPLSPSTNQTMNPTNTTNESATVIPEDDPTVIAPGPGSSIPSSDSGSGESSGGINRPLIIGVSVAGSFLAAMGVLVGAVVMGRRRQKRLRSERQKDQVLAYTDKVFRHTPARSATNRSTSTTTGTGTGMNPFTSILQTQRESSSERGGYATGNVTNMVPLNRSTAYPSTSSHVRRRSQSIDNHSQPGPTVGGGGGGNGTTTTTTTGPTESSLPQRGTGAKDRRILHPPSAFSISISEEEK